MISVGFSNRTLNADFRRRADLMQRLVILLGLGLVIAAAGCTATPAYSGEERGRMIARNWRFEREQIADDIDHALLLRPSSRLTIWAVR